MKTLLGLILIIAIAAGAYWYLRDDSHKKEFREAQQETAQKAGEIKDAVKDKLKDLSLSAPAIKDELERTGKVVRKKAKEVGSVIADATADARITTTIKAKLVKDPSLSALKISVSTTDGVVTLSGSVSSAEEVSQAISLALETDGAREVISTLQVKPNK
ncbi:MAG: BON domain-containing protein [Verrucomicrobiota bacterium]